MLDCEESLGKEGLHLSYAWNPKESYARQSDAGPHPFVVGQDFTRHSLNARYERRSQVYTSDSISD